LINALTLIKMIDVSPETKSCEKYMLNEK
jgi:hypothetical protein